MIDQLIDSSVLVVLMILTAQDIKSRTINPLILLPGALVSAILKLIGRSDYMASLLGMGVGLMILIIAKITREAIGYGDGLIFIYLGLSLGIGKVMLILLMTVGLISLSGLIMILPGKVNKKTRWPMIPWIFASVMLGVLIWYL